MLRAAKNLLKESMIVQTTYRRYVQPYLPQYEPETFILRGMRFDQCVDAGAHAGTFSILLSTNSDKIYAFEPVRRSFEILKALNLPNVVVHNLALGDQSGESIISLPKIGGEIDYALATLRSVSASDDVEIQKVRVAKFDDFETQIDFNRIDFVKIDVEGFEMRVLRGMTRLIESRKPALLIEVEERHNQQYREVFDYLAAQQYQPYVTVDGVMLQRFDVAELPGLQSAERLAKDEARKFRLGEAKSYINNFFFLRADHKARFRAT